MNENFVNIAVCNKKWSNLSGPEPGLNVKKTGEELERLCEEQEKSDEELEKTKKELEKKGEEETRGSTMCEGDELTMWQEVYHCWSVYIRPYGDGYSRESTPFGRIDYLLNNFTVLWVGL